MECHTGQTPIKNFILKSKTIIKQELTGGTFFLISNILVSPRDTEAIVGSRPNSDSSSECHATWSLQSLQIDKYLMCVTAARVNTFPQHIFRPEHQKYTFKFLIQYHAEYQYNAMLVLILKIYC